MPALKLRLSFGLEAVGAGRRRTGGRTVLNIEQNCARRCDAIEATRTSVLDTTAGLNAQIQAQVVEQLRAVGLRTTTINATSSQAQAEAAQALAALPAATPATPAERRWIGA